MAHGGGESLPSLDSNVLFANDGLRKAVYIDDIKRLCQQNGQPLNIVIIGFTGAGKSSFINTAIAALSRDKWHEHAYSGAHGGQGPRPMTVVNETFLGCRSMSLPEYAGVPLPNLIDVAGFPDEDTEIWEELLRIIFYGRLAKGERLAEAQEYAKHNGLKGLRDKYSAEDERLKVDRVVFVGEATQAVPGNLMECVMRAARPPATSNWKRYIPVYGVLTKCDKVDSIATQAARDIEREFVSKLGLDGARHRFLLCKNYCDDVDRGRRIETVIPELDVPVLRFLSQVCDPAQLVQWSEESYADGHQPTVPGPGAPPPGQTPVQETGQPQQPTPPPPNTAINLTPFFVIAMEAILVALVIHWFVVSPVSGVDLSAGCSRLHEHEHNVTKRKFPEFDKLCGYQEILSETRMWIPYVIFVVIQLLTHLLIQLLPAFRVAS